MQLNHYDSCGELIPFQREANIDIGNEKKKIINLKTKYGNGNDKAIYLNNKVQKYH